VRIYCQSVGSYSSEHSFDVKREGITIFSHERSDTPTSNQLFVTSDPINVRGSVITHDIAPTFTVIIPATVTLGEAATISAENVVLAHGEQVEVSLANANGFKVKSEQGAVLTYTVTKDETAVNEGDTVLTVNPTSGKTGETTLKFVAPGAAQFAGDYTGTVTFTISVNTVENS